MPTTTISKIQVRRGPLSDLPILDEGEFGYALDYHRLFIGNTPLTFTGNALTKRYTVQDRTILPNQISVLINNSEVNIGVEYSIDETDIVFASAPNAAEEIVYTVIGNNPSFFVGNGSTNSLIVQGYTEGSELVVVSYKNYDPINYVPLDVVRVFGQGTAFPNHIQLSSTAGLEVGQLFIVVLNPISGLVAGQNYYIRSINGDKITISLTEDPNTPIVTFNQTLTGLARARAGGDLLQLTENYTFNGTNLTFLDGNVPEGAAEIKISFNTEVKVQNSSDPHFRLPLSAEVFAVRDTGLSFSIPEANTALVDYSIRTSDEKLRVGTLQIITDGATGKIYDTGQAMSEDDIVFKLRIEANRLYLTYSNEGTASANFYYSIKLWNTI